MVTTVTTTTTTVTTVVAASVALIAILALVALLIQKEIFGSLDSPLAKQIARALNIAILPLVIVFIATAAFKVYDVLR